MVTILRVYDRPPLCIKLKKVQETSSGMTWIFTFWDRGYGFIQSVILPKVAGWEGMESAYEKIWETWTQEAKYREWKAGSN
jgi:hypothetical protein